MDHLPGVLLADIFRRLPPRSLASCRSVRKDWCAEVDAGRMLVPFADLVPRGFRGVFINYIDKDFHEVFSRAPVPPRCSIDVELEFTDIPGYAPRSKTILDHRNGLVLCRIGRAGAVVVCNPATRRSAAPLPRRRHPYEGGPMCLVFDPTVSLHYDVVSFPDAPSPSSSRSGQGSMEWPPACFRVQIFSSKTGRWEEKAFAREAGDAAAAPFTVSDVWADPWAPRSKWVGYHATQCLSVYWRGTLYVHCRGGLVIRLSLQEEKYGFTRTPKSDTFSRRARSFDVHEEGITPCEYLGKSKEGVYFTAIYRNQLRVWVLRDHHQVSDDDLHQSLVVPTVLEWELKYSADLQPSFLRHYIRLQASGEDEDHIITYVTWMSNRLDDGRRRRTRGWDSDDDDDYGVVADDDNVGDRVVGSVKKGRMHSELELLGFHPHKEIALLRKGCDGFAYRFGSSKLQSLGSLGFSSSSPKTFINSAFIYTPCMVDMFPGVNR